MATKDLRAEIKRLRDELHYANGVADLAIKHRDAAESKVERLRAALKPFVDLRDQPVSQTVKIINKGMDDLTPIAFVVTKGQVRAALDALEAANK